jgi:hypothetical protein
MRGIALLILMAFAFVFGRDAVTQAWFNQERDIASELAGFRCGLGWCWSRSASQSS